MERLFFAVWPDRAAALGLAALAKDLAQEAGGKPVPMEKIHLTIAFLGSLAPERARLARQAGAGARAAAFEIALDTVGSFRGARVAWVGCARVPEGLQRLHAEVGRSLAAHGFASGERDFSPHATLVRRLARMIGRRPSPPAAWHARELTLVRTETGTGRYTVVERWPLDGT